MAYEISEGAAAGALFLSPTMLNSMTAGKSEADVKKVMALIFANLERVNFGSTTEKTRYKTWFNPNNLNLSKTKAFGKDKNAKLTAVVHGCSAALGIRAFMQAEGDKWANTAKVYVTGAAWVSDISWLQVTVGGWKDYNSSDLVVVKGNCYYGISLKKTKKTSPRTFDLT